ncbi:MAG: type II toxin-antitoxin system RelE/ParE family toxin [Planctomycetes bacterium]|nr:type II toxin-antitoxin system RelE/ParE family toxin [Planctomycetota bacterium]
MAKIIWTNEAASRLEDIHDYIASENPSAAHKVVCGIYEKIQLLRSHPRLGQRYEPITDREVREVLYGHYRIAYLVKSEQHIEILGIFHGAMDIKRYLN